jgi:hypothetical protein
MRADFRSRRRFLFDETTVMVVDTELAADSRIDRMHFFRYGSVVWVRADGIIQTIFIMVRYPENIRRRTELVYGIL